MECRHYNNNMRGRNNSKHRGYSTYIASGAMCPNRDKKELESLFPDNLLLETLKTMENPLQKNLGDAYNMDRSHECLFQRDSYTHVRLEPENKVHGDIPGHQPPLNNAWRPDILPTFSGIANMISGLINNITGVITLHYNRTTIPEKNMASDKSALNTKPLNIDHQIDFGERDEVDASPPIDDAIRNFSQHDCAKNNLCENSGSLAQCSSCGGVAKAPPIAAMSLPALQDPADTCRAKMAKIQDLLSGKSSPKPKVRPYNRYVPKKVFVDPKFVEETMVDVFEPEPVEHLQNMDTTNFVNPGVIIQSHLTPAVVLPLIKLQTHHIDKLNKTEKGDKLTVSVECPEVKRNLEVGELVSMSSYTVVPGKAETDLTEIKQVEDQIDDKQFQQKKLSTDHMQEHGLRDDTTEIIANTEKHELILNCEDKVTRLKAMLAERKKNNLKSIPTVEQESTADIIEEVSLHFKSESNCPISVPKYCQSVFNSDSEASSFENSPKISVTSPDGFNEIQGRFESNSSDDSFVIVFSESPNPSPPSSPRDRLPSISSEDSFIVFEDDRPSCFTLDTEESDCESNLTSAGRYSQTLGDLTDESLYCDSRDCQNSEDSEDSESEDEDTVELVKTVEEKSRGVLLTEGKKQVRANQPEKRVRFSEAPPKVHRLCVWSYAARQARIGNWRQAAADAERFKRRIADVDMAISWVLKPAHRNRVKFQRFMPWWHAQRRIEVAERKAEAERKKKEEEARRAEEKRIEEERLAEEKRLEEERIAEEKRIEEEVREEMERERKSRKTISNEDFSMNLRIYLNKKKNQAGSPQVRIVPDAPKRKPQKKRNTNCHKSGSDIFTNSNDECQNMVNGFGEGCVSKTSNLNCDTGKVDFINETESGLGATEKNVNNSCDLNDKSTDSTAKTNIEVTVNRIANNDRIKHVNGLTEAVVIGIKKDI